MQLERYWREAFQKESQERYRTELKLRQMDIELMNERTEKKQLEKDLGEILTIVNDPAI